MDYSKASCMNLSRFIPIARRRAYSDHSQVLSLYLDHRSMAWTSRSLNHHAELMPLSYGWLSSLGNMERMKTDAMGAYERG